MRVRDITCITCIVILLTGCTSQDSKVTKTQEGIFAPSSLVLAGERFTLELADDREERSRGLSGRETLGLNEGMLFIFPDYSKPGFWMKDMLIPLDFVWLNNNEIVDVTAHVLPPQSADEPLDVLHPVTEVNRVLEIPAGNIDRLGIRVGMYVEYWP